jgi:hypothetical protein
MSTLVNIFQSFAQIPKVASIIKVSVIFVSFRKKFHKIAKICAQIRKFYYENAKTNVYVSNLMATEF